MAPLSRTELAPSASSPGSDALHGVRKYVRWVLRHGGMIWIVASVLAIPALVRTISLYVHLKSDIEELLPRGAPSVTALDELRSRMPGLRYLGILVDVGKADNLGAGERFLDDLGERVKRYPKNLVKRVKTDVIEERTFLERHAPLYADLDDLEAVRDRIESDRDHTASRAMGIDIDEGAEPSPVDLHDLEAKYRAKEKDANRFEKDRFSSRDKKVTLLLIEVAELTTGADLGNELFRRVERDIAELGSTDRYAPGMRLGFTGDIAIDHEELAALVQDLTASSVVVVVLVLLAIGLFYRWWGGIPALLVPLFVAATYAFALVTLWPLRITNLNSNTAFLASVIVGNGVNFGIVMLARYVEERRRGSSIEEALVTALCGSRVGTGVAALAAAAAYGSLAFTQFRGFKQFGIIGGIGMVACWVCAFVLGPPLIAWLDRKGGSIRRPARQGLSLMGRLAAGVTQHPLPIVLASFALTILAVGEVKKLGPDFIEYNFSHLRRADSRVSGEAYWGRKMDDLMGRYLTPLVMLTDNPAQATKLAAALRMAAERQPLSGTIDSVVSIDNVVPANQLEKLSVLRDLERDLTPRVRAQLTDDQRKLLDRYLARDSLVPLVPSDLPAALTTGLRERDGAYDRAVLVYPHPSQATWQGPAIREMTTALRQVADVSAEPGARAARLAGSIPLSSDIISSIERDGPLATAFALAAVVVLVIAIFRTSLATPLILGSLTIAVLWLTAGIMALGVKINFANFIAFPITFGIGVDYAVNVMARYRESDPPDVIAAIKSTGGAVLLCSCTTIIGYSSLLFAQNQALFLFGVVAVLGEVACILTAVVVLPAVLVLIQKRFPSSFSVGRIQARL